MPVNVDVETLPSLLTEIVASVFETMMNLPVVESGEEWRPGGDRLTAGVQLAGPWSGAVLVECGRREACRFTGRFLSMDPPDTVSELVRDVMGELANMIGGNLKCLLTGGIDLSTPVVLDGCASNGAEQGMRDLLAFHSPEGPFWVTLVS